MAHAPLLLIIVVVVFFLVVVLRAREERRGRASGTGVRGELGRTRRKGKWRWRRSLNFDGNAVKREWSNLPVTMRGSRSDERKSGSEGGGGRSSGGGESAIESIGEQKWQVDSVRAKRLHRYVCLRKK
jgi:uncharacterized membrane protein YgcG